MFRLFNRKRIGVVQFFGTIGGGIRPAAYDDLLGSAQRDASIRALVLDIDSPGGSVTASDGLYRKLSAIAATKPVVASIRGTGASGGYLLCCAAQRIIASPGAMVGSIGVISVRPVMEGLLDKLGVEVSVNKSGAWKDMGAVWRQSTPEESQRLQAFVDEAFDSFVLAVAKARKMDVEKARAVATGEVYWAPKAKSVGLVDELGDLDRAIEVAAELAKVPKGRTTRLALKKSWREKMFSPLAESFAESVSSEIERRVWMNSLRY